MAVSGITDRNSMLLSALASRPGVNLRPNLQQPGGVLSYLAAASALRGLRVVNQNVQQGSSPLSNAEVSTPVLAVQTSTTAAAISASEAPIPDAIQQNAMLTNGVLRNLRYTPAGSAGMLQFSARSPLLTALQEGQELNQIQQNALFVNETIRNFGFSAAEPANPLLIDEITPALAASKITEDLDLGGSTAREVTAILQGLGAAAHGAAAQANAMAPSTPAVGPLAAVTGEATAVALAGVNSNLAGTIPAVAATPTAAAATAGVAVAAVLPATVTFLTAGLTPVTQPLTIAPDRTPYVLAVYQIKDPAPPPENPAPIDSDVQPVTSIGGAKAVGDARLRQTMLRARAKEQTLNIEHHIEYNPPVVSSLQAEKSIRLALGLVNADLVARDLPFHLVFAKNEQGFTVDVYNCLSSDACRVSYDVPIALDNLPGFFDSLEHETGIIVDTMS